MILSLSASFFIEYPQKPQVDSVTSRQEQRQQYGTLSTIFYSLGDRFSEEKCSKIKCHWSSTLHRWQSLMFFFFFNKTLAAPNVVGLQVIPLQVIYLSIKIASADLSPSSPNAWQFHVHDLSKSYRYSGYTLQRICAPSKLSAKSLWKDIQPVKVTFENSLEQPDPGEKRGGNTLTETFSSVKDK